VARAWVARHGSGIARPWQRSSRST
jgi:hypothetical protein